MNQQKLNEAFGLIVFIEGILGCIAFSILVAADSFGKKQWIEKHQLWLIASFGVLMMVLLAVAVISGLLMKKKTPD